MRLDPLHAAMYSREAGNFVGSAVNSQAASIPARALYFISEPTHTRLNLCPVVLAVAFHSILVDLVFVLHFACTHWALVSFSDESDNALHLISHFCPDDVRISKPIKASVIEPFNDSVLRPFKTAVFG